MRDRGLRADEAYRVEIIGLRRGLFTVSSGLRLHADLAFAEVGAGIDTLMIAGGVGSERYSSDTALLNWLRRQAKLVRRLASVCTGAFFLAESAFSRGVARRRTGVRVTS